MRFSRYEIHHEDRNKLNNHSSNLKVLTPEEHRAIHGFSTGGGSHWSWSHFFASPAWRLQKSYGNGAWAVAAIVVFGIVAAIGSYDESIVYDKPPVATYIDENGVNWNKMFETFSCDLTPDDIKSDYDILLRSQGGTDDNILFLTLEDRSKYQDLHLFFEDDKLIRIEQQRRVLEENVRECN